MSPQQPRQAGYHDGLNRHLLDAVPPEALRLLEVGCGAGRLGAALKAQHPGRTVFGAERDRQAAALAARGLDRVFALDVEREEVPLPPGSLDALLYGDALAHFTDPLGVLLRHRRLLRPGGLVLCCVANVQHHSILAALLRGDWQYQPAGLLDREHFRFFTCSTALKLLLDAGLAPRIVEATQVPASDALVRALLPLLAHLGLHPERTRRYLESYQYILRGELLPDALDDDEVGQEPLTFAVCVSDEAMLQANLLASPCLGAKSPHQVLLFRGCGSAAEGLNAALAVGRHRVVVCVHQDVYLPRGWVRRFWRSWREAEAQFGKVGVAGVYGVALREGAEVRAGHVVDRDRLLWQTPALPAAVDTLDELLLAIPRESGLRLDPALGFHLYGADVCLEARKRNLAAVTLEALCLHNSRSVALPPEFEASSRVLIRKWSAALPVATACAVIGPDGIRPPGARPGATP